MKKFAIVVLAVLSLISLETKAQTFQKGDNLFNAGLGFGYYTYGLGFNRSFSIPALTANYEIGIGDFIGVGPYAGIASWNYSGFGFNGAHSILTFGGRATVHLTDFLLNDALELDVDENLDFYATLIMGLTIETYSGDFTATRENEINRSFGPVLGFRYYFSESFAGYIEAGRGSFSYGTLGLTLKM